MNWIRDNILKVVLITFTLIVITVIIVACSMGGGKPVDSASGYIELENKLQNAAISYVNEHPSILPKTTETIKKVKLNTLIEAGKINKLYAVDNKSIVCKGHVEIEKISEEEQNYRYTPYISCGKYYVTKTIANYIIDKETQNGEFVRTADAGLYNINDEYVFKGEYPNNFIYLGDHLYRIIKIDNENHLKLISTTRTLGYYTWDDRYNITKDTEVGINDFLKSRLYEGLDFIYNNVDEEEGEVFFSELEKSYIVEHDFCYGKRDVNDTNMYSGVECTETVPLKVGLINVNEYPIASIDPNCKGLYDKSCANYNYFVMLDTKRDNNIVTLTAASNDSYSFYKIDYREVDVKKTDSSASLFPVIYISDRVIYKSGSGTYLDPYIVR